MLRLKNPKPGRTFRQREYDRAVGDVIYFVVYLGLGGPFHATPIDYLVDFLHLRTRYVNLSRQEVEEVIRHTDGRTQNVWRIEVTDNLVRIV